jgi:2'-5' RNA ligase
MAKPYSDLAEWMWRSLRAQPNRAAGLLHVTMLKLAIDLADHTGALLPFLLAAMQDFQGNAFRMVFDRVVETGHVTLHGSEPMLGVTSFQAALMDHLLRREFEFLGDAPVPHMTLRYGTDGRGSETIDPISWRVEELLLIESVHGQARHRVRGRWPLATG